MGQARIVDVTRVLLSPAGAPPLEPVWLSFLDTFWIMFPHVQRLLLYRTDRPFASVVEELRGSLYRTLPRFHSLAGTLTHVPESGDVVISFSGGGHDGVDFVEAEAQGVDFERLAEDQDHDLECFLSLVPGMDVLELPMPVFSVQVTGFAGGGVAVGFSMHHMAADGKALWQFVETWAAECRRGAAGGGAGVSEPVLDRSVIRHPRAEEMARSFVRQCAPDLPRVSHPYLQPPERRRLSRRTFVVSAASIASLRDRGTTGSARPSAFVALSAHLWLSFLRAKGLPPDDQIAALFFVADCRRHLDPPVGDNYFGNCVRVCPVEARCSELLGGGFAAACVAIRRAIDGCLREPLSDVETWVESILGLPMGRLLNILASPRFRVYDQADFGWGRPRRVELVSMNYDGLAALVGAREDEGAVQASVALSPLHMDGFATLFLGLQKGT